MPALASLNRNSLLLMAAVWEPAVAVRRPISCRLVLTVCRCSVCLTKHAASVSPSRFSCVTYHCTTHERYVRNAGSVQT